MAFTFDANTAQAENTFDPSTAEVEKPSGALRKAVGDKVVGFASGAVGATKAIADAAGAGNAVSSTLEDVNKGINEYLSPEAKADQQEQSAIMDSAKGQGIWEGVKAGARAFGVAPVQTAVQGLGSIVPVLAGGLAGLPGAAATGVAMGAGTAKGAIYDRIKKEGSTEEAAIQAQAYNGANTDQIALGGALGVADALTGVGRIAGGMVRGAIGKPVAQAAERGILKSTGMGMLGEMPLEAAQGGQEQVAANLAAQRAGYKAGTWDNVASNATLEALASAGPGATFGALDRRAPMQQTAPELEQVPPGSTPPLEQVPTNQADPSSLPLEQVPDEAPSAPPENGMGFNPDAGKMTQFHDGSQSFSSEVPSATAPKPSEAMGLTPTDTPSLTNAAIIAVDSGASQPVAIPEAQADPVGAAQDEYRAQTAAMLQKQDEQAYQAYIDAIDQAKVAQDETPGETLTSVTPIANVLADFDSLTDDEFFAQLGATPEETQDAIANQPSSPQASAANPLSSAPDVAASPLTSAAAVDTKAANLARIQAANKPQPTKVGTQTNAVAGPAFSAKDVVKPVSQPAQPVAGQGAGATQPTQGALSKSEQAKADLEHLFGLPEKRAKAIERIAKGTAYFSKPLKAQEFIAKNGLKETHQSVKTARGWDIVAKPGVATGSNLPPTDISIGDTVRKNGTDYTVTGAIDGGIKAEREISQKNGVTQTETVFLKGDDAIQAKIDSQLQGPASEPKAPQAIESKPQEAQAPAAVAPELVKTKTSQGITTYVRKSDLDGDLAVIRMFTKDGKSNGRIHRENIDPTGEKQAGHNADNASNPLFDVVTNKEGGAFATVVAARRALNQRGLQSTHIVAKASDVSDGAAGFVIRKKQVPTPAVEQVPEGAISNRTLPDAPKPTIVTDKAEMRPYRKPDGSVGYEAVPIQAETTVEPAAKAAKAETMRKLAKINEQMPEGFEAADGAFGIGLFKNNWRQGQQIPEQAGYSPDPIAAEATHAEADLPNVPPVAPSVATSKPEVKDPLTDKEKAAKAKMFNALGKLAALAGKNTRMNWTQEEEQQILPIVIELFDGAMDLGAVTFQKAVRYVREFIAGGIDQETADSIPFETLQGAYIATSGRHKDKAVTPKREVAAFDSLEELDKSVEKADIETKDTPNATRQLDSAGQSPLEGVPADKVQGTPEDGETATSSDGRSGPDAEGTRNTDGARVPVRGSLGDDQGGLPVPARGGRGKRGGSKQSGVSGNADVPQGNGSVDTSGGTGGLIPVNPAPNAAPIAAPAFDPQDFTIEDDFALGEGGAKAKFKGNIAAIRLVAQLDTEQRAATPTEQKVLAAYVGWGGLAQAFDENNSDWSKEYAELKGLMSEDDYADARASTRYAHYTSRQVIQDGIYAALKHFGFNGGRALEGGAGVGNFIGLMPAEMRSASRFTAIEREPFSAKIARNLYPKQNIQEADFTDFVGNDDFYDVAVGNPPFASDPQVDRSGRKHLSGLSLHNYFFAKEVDMLREGGILAQVVTNSFLDATTDTARQYIADKTKFLGAIRLPNNAFSKNAGTEVTTDLIFLQKRPESEWGGKAAKTDAKQWLGVGQIRDKEGRTVALNQYFINHPEMMLGKFGAYGTMYRGESPALVQNPGQDTTALLKDAVARLPSAVYVDRAITNTASIQDALVKTLSQPSVHEGGYFEEDGKLFQRIKDIAGEARGKEITPETMWTAKTKLGDAGFARIKALSAMRETVRSLLAAELSNDPKMVELRKTLNTQYDAYDKEHGRINDPGTLRVFDDDPDFPLLASLEHGYTPAIGVVAARSMGIKPVPSKATKGPIFTQRVIDARQQVMKVETPADALAVSMAERGKLDSAYIGELLGREADEVLRELSSGDKPLLFKDPATGEYALRDAYLSGNVRAKLVQAKQAGMFNNIKALEEVQPADVGSHEINARIGSPWVPESVYTDFAKALFGDGTTSSIKYVKETAGYGAYVAAGNSTANTNTWGTSDYPGTDILAALLNNKPIKVTYKDADGNLRTHTEATEKANIKAQEIRDKFQDWLFADIDRAEILGRAYNDTNNNYVTREFDGEWMTFPGKVPNSIVKFRRHQRNAIARIVQDRTALLDHVVGSGKTYTIIAAAMELRRTGLAKKPMIAVPNHLVKQWAADFYKLYPGANILTATKKDFEKSNRRKFLARIATGDWDAVIIAHSSFGFIKPAPDFEHKFNAEQVANIVKTIKEVENGDGDKQQKKRTVKQLEGIKERLENRIKALRDKPMDALLDFGEIGVDQLFVDEAHMFKNLMFTTKMQNIAGLGDSTGSQRAYDMYVKSNQIYNQNGRGQGVVFATGTPVSNSLAEMYHMMRYLMPVQMKDMGFESFDAWANTFASVEQVWMQKASGDGFKAQNRMSNFVNTPELLKVFDQVSDTVTMDDIKKAFSEENDGAEFPLPKLKDGKRTPVSLVKSDGQNAYMADIANRALVLEQRKGPPQKGEDNILVIMSDARKAAMDIRLVDPTVMQREVGGRIDRSSQEIFARYQQYDKVKGTQIVFSDLGTPLKSAKKELAEYQALQERIQNGAGEQLMQRASMGDESAQEKIDDAEDAQDELDAKGKDWLGAVQAAERGFSVYDDLKLALMERGIPDNEIAFIHDYNTDEQKAGLFRKMNSGQIRVLMGSTPKLGAGTNVQERLVALHHLDVPWKPSDVEQREGRIIRQGNKLDTQIPEFEVEVLAYVTQDTLDMRMWQVQETKLRMINQLRTRKIDRDIENAFEDLELSAGEMQAAATGNMDLLREIQIKGDLKKLEQRKRAFDAQKSDLQNRKKSNAQKLETLPAKIESSKPMADATDEYKQAVSDQEAKFTVTIDGKEYTDAKEAGSLLLDMVDAHVYLQRQADGKFGGRQLTLNQMENEPWQDPKAADYNPWTKRPVPLSVDVNGVRYTSRDKLLEAFSDLRGDKEAIAWSMDGKTLIRRSAIEGAIRQSVADAIAEEQVKDIGALGPFKVAVEGYTSRTEKVIDVTLTANGQTISNSRGLGKVDENTAQNSVRSIINMAENLAIGARQQHEYEKRQLQQALKEKTELDVAETKGDWPDQGRLEDLRKKHQEVLKRLSGVKAAVSAKSLLPLKPERMPPLSGLFKTSRIGTSSPMKLSLDAVKKSVQSALKRIPNAPRIEVHTSPSSIGITPPNGVVPKGVTLDDGSIIIFSDAAESVLDVFQTVFHELFHRGSKVRFANNSDYIKTMLDIAASDPMVSAEANQWKKTSDGVAKLAEFSAKGPMTGDRLANYEALAVEEALASMGERFADKHLGKKMMLRKIADFLSKVAKAWGMDGLSKWLSDEKLTVTEQFILDTIRMSGGVPNTFTTALLFRSGSVGETIAAATNNARNVKLPADYVVGDFLNSAPGKLGWWHKTVGTQYHLAQKSKPFKRVFDSVQTFLNDVSFYATEAADMAPNILPKLETWKDIAKKPVSAEDTKAFSRPVFEGTLTWARDESGKAVKMEVIEAAAAKLTIDQKSQRLLRGNHISEGVLKMWRGLPIDQYEAMIESKYERDMLKAGIVFTDAELKQHFSLTPNQIKLYREFRKATDKSLTNLAIADMLRFGGKDVEQIRDVALESKSAEQASETLSKYLLSLADIEPDRADVLIDTANKMIDKGDKATDLMNRGYAPLSRFGQYTLDVVDANGERVYFGMFESKWEAAKMTRNMQEQHPNAEIKQGTVSEEEYKMFAGVSPETLELFGDMLGLEAQGDTASAQAFQEYLKLAKSNRSAMKRLIQRKGIAGFNEDAGRVLAGFVYSNARQTSSSLHMGEMTNAANEMPKQQGELKDAAVRLVDYIKNPQEEAQAIRGLMFTQFIGGSIASAMVNLTQPLTMTLPWLSQYGGASNAAKTMTTAIKDAYKKSTGDAKLDAALKLAEEKGIVSPQEVHQLQQQAQGKAALRSGDGSKFGDAAAAAQNSLSRFMLAWGKPFSWAEQMNRRVTFIAAYRTAVSQKMPNPMAFAEQAINETQGIYNKGNKPVFGRGAMGGMLMVFKQFSISYVEMLQRMHKNGPEGKRAALLALGILFLLSGASGLPGSDDLDDIISGALQSFGYNFDSKQKRKEFFVSIMGEDGARFMERGISGLPGVPIDIAGRLGSGNLLPGTGFFVKKPDHTRDAAELFGPVGSFVKQAYDASWKVLNGEILGARGAIATISPLAAKNMLKAAEMVSTDMYKDDKGNKVISTDLQDALVKALGFQPNDVARLQDASFDVQRMIGVNKMRETEIADQWAKGLFEKDPSKVQEARAELAQWNADNPESPIRINFRQIMQRLKAMNATKAERIAKTAPKEIRSAVKRELAIQ